MMEPDEGDAYKAGLADGCAFMKQILRQALSEEKENVGYDFNVNDAVELIERLEGLCK